MALERSLKLVYLDNADRYTTTFSHANPAVTPTVLNTAMRQLNNLTTNTYVDTYVIDTQSLNELIAADNIDAGSGI